MILHIPDSLLAAPALDRFGRPIPPFDWQRWENHVSTIIGLAILAGLYLWAIGPMRRRAGVTERATGWQVTSFFSGLLVTFVALNGPVHDLAEGGRFSAHMVQHLILTLVTPSLLLAGTPSFMADASAAGSTSGPRQTMGATVMPSRLAARSTDSSCNDATGAS